MNKTESNLEQLIEVNHALTISETNLLKKQRYASNSNIRFAAQMAAIKIREAKAAIEQFLMVQDE